MLYDIGLIPVKCKIKVVDFLLVQRKHILPVIPCQSLKCKQNKSVFTFVLLVCDAFQDGLPAGLLCGNVSGAGSALKTHLHGRDGTCTRKIKACRHFRWKLLRLGNKTVVRVRKNVTFWLK